MRDSRPPLTRAPWFGLAAAVVLVAASALARWALADVLGGSAVFMAFLPAVALSAYIGGAWPGLLATLLGAFAADALFLRMSDRDPTVTGGEMLQVGLFLVSGAFVSLLSESLLRSRRAAADAMAAACRADERYRTFIDQSSEGIWRLELERPVDTTASEDEQVEALYRHGYLAECNDAMARMYGHARAAQLVGARLGDLLARDDPRDGEYLRRFVRGGYRLVDCESHERDARGTPRVFVNNLVGVLDDGGDDDGRGGVRRLVRAWGTRRDVTEQQAQQQRLSLYREIFAHSNDGIAIIDAHGKYLEQNAAHRALTGFTDDDLRDRTPAIHLGEEQFARVARELAVGGSWRGEAVSCVKSGARVPVEMSAFAVRDAAGNPVCYVGIKRDMTARKRAEVRLTAEHAVTRILADAGSLDEAAPLIVQAIRNSLHAKVGELWLPDGPAEVLRCAETSCDGDDPRAAAFARRSRGMTFARGVGLPGRAWASGVPECVADVVNDPNFPRAPFAAEAGLHGGGMAFPIAHGGEFFGVMEFLTEQAMEPDAGLLSMMGAIGSEIGQFIRRRRAEDQLRRSQRDLTDFVENATVGLHWVGPDGIIVWANQAELDLLGYARDEYVGRHVGEFHADQRVIDSILQCLSSGRTLQDFPARLRCRDGSIKHVLIDSNVMFEDGKFVHTRCFTRDVTEKKIAEEQLRSSAQSLRLALEAGRMGTWEWDVAADRVTCSPGLEAIHCASPGALAGTFDELLARCHPDDRARVTDEIRQTVAARLDHHLEYRVRLADGSVRWVEGRGRVYCDAAGRPQRVVGACTDITRRKRAEQERDELLVRERQARAEAERANRAKDEFLAVLSHELRTPLTPVLLTTTLLEGSPELSSEMKEDLRTIRRNVELEARLIDDLLDLTRIARGKLQLQLETVDVHSLVRSAVDICHQSNEINLVLDLSAAKHFVRADPARLQQVFWNLLNNAHKFTPAGGTIRVRSRNATAAGADGRVRIEVSDTGVGIDPELLPRIFAAFEQGPGDPRRFGGLGLGLAISKALVDALGGRIAALSDGRDKGATFVVELPTVRAAAPRSAARAPSTRPASELTPGDDASAPTARSLRILIVEDHEATRFVMTKLLADLGHTPVSAGDVESAMRAAQENPIDLLISDLGLPDGSGHELMREIRRLYAVRGIALSGYGMDEDLKRSEEAGFAEHLTKPVDLTRLQAAIRRVTEQPVVA